MRDLVGLVLIVGITGLSARFAWFLVGLFRRDKYVEFAPDDEWFDE